MSVTVAKLVAVIEANSDNLKRGARDAERSLEQVGKKADEVSEKARNTFKKNAGVWAETSRQLTNIGRSMTIGITAPLALMGRAFVKSYAEMDSLRRGMEAVMGSASAAKAEMKELIEVAKLPGLGLKEAYQGSINLQAAGFSAEQARKSLMGFGNALATVGKGKAQLDLVTYALTQMMSVGKVLGGDLRQLQNQLPQLKTVMRDTFGTDTAAGINKLNISSEEFIRKVTDGFLKLNRVTGGIKNSLENVEDAFTQFKATVGESIGKIIAPMIDDLSQKMVEWADAWKGLSEPTQKMIIGFTTMLAIGGPLLLLMGKIAGAISAINLALAGMQIAAGPVWWIVGGLVAVGAALVTVWANSKDATQAMKEQVQQEAEIAKEHYVQAAKIKNLGDEYIKLKDNVKQTEDSKKRLQEIMDKIGQMSPDLVTGWDNQGHAISLVAGWADKATVSLKNMGEQARIAAGRVAATRVGAIADEMDKLRDLIDLRKKADAELAEQKRIMGQYSSWGTGHGLILGHMGEERSLKQLYADLATKTREWGDARKALNVAMKKGVDITKELNAGQGRPKGTDKPEEGGGGTKKESEAVKLMKEGIEALRRLHQEYAMLFDPRAKIVELAGIELDHYKKLNPELQKSIAIAAMRLDMEQKERQYMEELNQKIKDSKNVWSEIGRAMKEASDQRNKQASDLIKDAELDLALTKESNELEKYRMKLESERFAFLTKAEKDHLMRLREEKWLFETMQASAGMKKGTWWDVLGEGLKELLDKMKEAQNLKFQETLRDIATQFGVLDQKAAQLAMKMALIKGGLSDSQAAFIVWIKTVLEAFQKAREESQRLAEKLTDTIMGVFNDLLNNGFKNFFSAVYSGFRKLLADMAMEWIRSQLMRMIMKGLGGAGSNDFMGMIGKVFGGRASGGPVTPSQLYMVGEKGPELFSPSSAGSIISTSTIMRAISSMKTSGGATHLTEISRGGDSSSSERSSSFQRMERQMIFSPTFIVKTNDPEAFQRSSRAIIRDSQRTMQREGRRT